jgi:CHAD domain-containing protein
MAYRFNIAEPVETGVRRIAREQIDEALAAIQSPDLALERVVHEVRRRCKALRALVRLVRPVFPGFDRENAAFRDIARALAGLRDGKVLIDTLDDLTDDESDEAAQRLIARLRKRFAKPTAKALAVRKALEACAEQLRAARGRVAHWSLDAQGWDALSEGFAKTVKSARHAMTSLARADDAERSHEWRKHVKHHWHHMRLLRPAGPEAAGERIRLSARLGDLLGERHDLDLFVATLAAQPRRGADAARLDLLAAKARKRAAKLEHKAGQLGERLFDEKPRRLAAKWGERWRVQAREAAFA